MCLDVFARLQNSMHIVPREANWVEYGMSELDSDLSRAGGII